MEHTFGYSSPVQSLLSDLCQAANYEYAEMWKRRREDTISATAENNHERSSWLGFPRTPQMRTTEMQSPNHVLQPALRFSGDTYTATDSFEALELETLERLKETAATLTLGKGEGLVGMAWSKGALDQQDLSDIPADAAGFASDLRFPDLKAIFKSSVAIPLGDWADSSQIEAVMVLYRRETPILEERRESHTSFAGSEPGAVGGPGRVGSWGGGGGSGVHSSVRSGVHSGVQRGGSAASSGAHASEIQSGDGRAGSTRSHSHRRERPSATSYRLPLPLFASAAKTAVAALQVQEALPAWQESVLKCTHSDTSAEGDKATVINSPGDPQPPSLSRWEAFQAAGAIYLSKFKGQGQQPPSANGLEFCGFAFVGSFLAVLLMSYIDLGLINVDYKDQSSLFAMVSSFGSVATMIFGAPTSPLVQPRNLLFAHLIASAIALLLDYLTSNQYAPIIPQWVASALAPALSNAVLTRLGLIHPPACACATIYISSGPMSNTPHARKLSWLFIAAPVLIDCLLMLSVGLIVNNLSRHRKYPLFW